MLTTNFNTTLNTFVNDNFKIFIFSILFRLCYFAAVFIFFIVQNATVCSLNFAIFGKDVVIILLRITLRITFKY